MWLAPTDVNTEYDGIDLVEETMAVQLCSPGCRWTAPRGIRNDARLHAAMSKLCKDARSFDVEPCACEDWHQERLAGVGKLGVVEFDVVLEQCTDAATQWPHRMILALPVESHGVRKQLLCVDFSKWKAERRNRTAKAVPENRGELLRAVVPD
jgi:hypothetical protein